MLDRREVIMEGWGDEPDEVREVSVPARPWSIQPHDGVDKQFAIEDAHGRPVVYFDYDDVDHHEVDLTAEFVVWAINNAEATREDT